MTYRAWLPAYAKPGQRETLVHAFIEQRVIEQCRQSIPGFCSGELLLSEDNPDLLCVTVEWIDRQSFLDWQASPVRAAQTPALAALLCTLPVSQLFQRVQVVPKAAGSTG